MSDSPAMPKMESLHLIKRGSDFGHYLVRKWSKKDSPELGSENYFPLAFFWAKRSEKLRFSKAVEKFKVSTFFNLNKS